MAIVVPNGFRIVELEEVAFTEGVHMNDGECAIGHTALFADGQCLNDGLNALFHIGAAGHHSAENLAGESGEDIGFHTAAQAIG